MKCTKDFKAELCVLPAVLKSVDARRRDKEGDILSETHDIYNTYWISFCGSGYCCPRVSSGAAPAALQALATCIIACMEFIESLAPPEYSKRLQEAGAATGNYWAVAKWRHKMSAHIAVVAWAAGCGMRDAGWAAHETGAITVWQTDLFSCLAHCCCCSWAGWQLLLPPAGQILVFYTFIATAAARRRLRLPGYGAVFWLRCTLSHFSSLASSLSLRLSLRH